MKERERERINYFIKFKKIIKFILELFFEFEASLAKRWASAAHRRLFLAQWGIKPCPEWFDHSIDLYWQWTETQNSLWLERGVYGSLGLKCKNLLELCCGDGFNSKHFYSHRSKKVTACDFDPTAIKTAQKKNNAPNITFVLADIRVAMPSGKFKNIAWDASIEHFTPDEIYSIMKNIKDRLTSDGVLSGYTIKQRNDGIKQNTLHEYEFKNMGDLKRFLTPYFKNVTVFETIYPSRHNLYFWASDSIIPFSSDWPHSE